MGESKAVRLDGSSPLSQYVKLLVSVPSKLKRLLGRDAEAFRILTIEPALPEALRRVERAYWRRQAQRRKGRV